jgi:hypothetical protein
LESCVFRRNEFQQRLGPLFGGYKPLFVLADFVVMGIMAPQDPISETDALVMRQLGREFSKNAVQYLVGELQVGVVRHPHPQRCGE